MSHITKFQQVVTDIKTFCDTAERLGHKIKIAKNGETLDVRQYGTNMVKGIAEVHFKDWKYPVAINENGEIFYDHWGSKPGTIEHLGGTLQEYNLTMIKKHLPIDEIQMHTVKTSDNGDKIITIEY